MKVLITGATGLIGSRLTRRLIELGHDDLVLFTRNKEKLEKQLSFPAEVCEWHPNREAAPTKAFEGVDAIIHLAGENIAGGRWTTEKKRAIHDSRRIGTKNLMLGLAQSGQQPRVVVSASAVGIYGDRGAEELNEKSEHADDFLATVCQDWEASLFDSPPENVRKVSLRTGIVLAPEGGALHKMLPAFKLGIAGRLGSGRQHMSWIHIDDLVNLYIHAIENDSVRGPLNAVAPTPVTNYDFTKTLGQILHRPTVLPVPAPALKLLFGEMSSILLGGQKAHPEKTLLTGFKYRYPELEGALRELLGESVRGEEVLYTEQWLSHPVKEVFPFFSDIHNLEKITPPFLNFKVHQASTSKIQEGTLIDYKLKLRGLPLAWQSRIENWGPDYQFVDTQVKGPYQKWQHTHRFLPMKNGTLVTDKIIYKLPGGFIGKLLAHIPVKRDLKQIFKFRRRKLREIFP